MTTMIAKQVLYSGRVQGVGFRYTVKQIASGFDITGWVKNLPDGRVELQAMAHDAEELEAFLQDIDESNLGSFIKEKEVASIPPLVGCRTFSIAR